MCLTSLPWPGEGRGERRERERKERRKEERWGGVKREVLYKSAGSVSHNERLTTKMWSGAWVLLSPASGRSSAVHLSVFANPAWGGAVVFSCFPSTAAPLQTGNSGGKCERSCSPSAARLNLKFYATWRPRCVRPGECHLAVMIG